MSDKGVKFDSEKPDLSLLPKDALFEIAQVLMMGEKKYGRYNWQNSIEINRLLAAAMRHILQFNDGEDNDPESGRSHLAHGACNLMFAIWMMKHRPDVDNRRKPVEKSVQVILEQKMIVDKDNIKFYSPIRNPHDNE